MVQTSTPGRLAQRSRVKIENELVEPAGRHENGDAHVGLPAFAPANSYSAVTNGEIYGLMNFVASGVASDGGTLLQGARSRRWVDSAI